MFCTIKVSVIKYDAFGFLAEKHFSFFSKTISFIVLVLSSKYPDLKLDLITRFWALGYNHFVALSSDH